MNIEEIKVRLDNLSKRGLEGFEAKEHFRANAESDIDYLLSIIETAEKALGYYADLNKHAYHDAIQGELYSDWWLRQSDVAVEALQVIRGK